MMRACMSGNRLLILLRIAIDRDCHLFCLLCSNPDCRAATSGPKSQPEKAVILSLRQESMDEAEISVLEMSDFHDAQNRYET
jgi:pyruvate-formate lyase-activating enzyme